MVCAVVGFATVPHEIGPVLSFLRALPVATPQPSNVTWCDMRGSFTKPCHFAVARHGARGMWNVHSSSKQMPTVTEVV